MANVFSKTRGGGTRKPKTTAKRKPKRNIKTKSDAIIKTGRKNSPYKPY